MSSLNDPVLVTQTTVTTPAADYISAVVEDGVGATPFTLVAGDVLEIRKLPGGIGPGDLFMDGTVPAGAIWEVTINVSIRQEPPQ